MQCYTCRDVATVNCCCLTFCTSCIAAHMMQLAVTKHSPVHHLSQKDPVLLSSIRSRLLNELLELEEFKKYSLQVIQTFSSSAKSIIKSFCTAKQNSVLSKCKEIEAALNLSLIKLALPDSTPTLDLFKSCKTSEDIKEVKIIDKSINCIQSLFEDVLEDSISFSLELYEPEEVLISTMPRNRSFEVASSAFSDPIKGHHFPKAFVETVFNFVPMASKLEFCSLHSLEFEDLVLDGQKFPACAAWSVTEDSKLVMTGGLDENARKECFMFNIFGRKIEKMPKMNGSRFNHAQISIGCYVYVFGGRAEVGLRECERFSLNRKEWSSIGKLNVAREFPAVSHCNGKIFVFGGAGVESIEFCKVTKPVFKIMNLRLSSPGRCCCFSYDGEIFVLSKTGTFRYIVKEEKMVVLSHSENPETWSSCEPVITSSLISWVSFNTFLSYKPSHNLILPLSRL